MLGYIILDNDLRILDHTYTEMSSVVVLAPNGRRQTVKCTPNTTILQIIEEVCKKQDIKAEEYDIKHHNKILDPSTTFRFSGLPNNAQLELSATLKGRQEGNITLAVNLENGTRLTDIFSPNDTLLNILQKLCPEQISPDKNPVVVYTRREIYGNELENCTLRSLGLVGGRAMIRVLNRDPELLKQQANVSAPLPSKPIEEKPYIRKFQPLEETPKPEKVDENPKSENDLNTELEIQNETIKPAKNMKNSTVDLFKLAKEKRKSQETPRSPEVQMEKKKNIAKQSTWNQSHEKAQYSKVENTVVPQKSIEEEFVFCGDRNGMIFSLESAYSVPSEDLPDDFFDLTIDDAKKILRDVKRKRHELENQVLRTSQLRSLEESKNQLRQLNRYKRAIIRVQFPDRIVVQGTFKPTETVQDIINFIRTYLEDESMDFYIYSTPPKEVLKQDSRLIEIGCVPGALLYFGTNGELKENFLKKEFHNKITTNSVASLAAARIRQENTRNIQEDQEDLNDQHMDVEEQNSSVNYEASTSNDSSGIERKIVSNSKDFPKWFKPL
ncbi:hypothetical protein ABEB36_001495 [Hypothenemus hampei]|uniref:UBX domain-containing protein n=1 Tax=Hypothenemus hampei TaxID=57062 RepID=A0ABD1FFE1_HYPHA